MNRRRAHLSPNPIIRATNERAIYVPLDKKKKRKKATSFHLWPTPKNRVENSWYHSIVARARHLHPLESAFSSSTDHGCSYRGDTWVVAIYIALCSSFRLWKSAGRWTFFPSTTRGGEGQSGRESGGLLTSFDESVFFVRADYRLDSFSPFAMVPLCSLPLSSVSLSSSAIVVRGCSADIKLHTEDVRGKEGGRELLPRHRCIWKENLLLEIVHIAGLSIELLSASSRIVLDEGLEVFSCKVT